MKKLSINTFKYKRNKYLTEIQSIDLLQRLQQLLSHGFTLYQSFKFLNSYFKYKERTINKKIIQHLQNGATCYDILKIIGYPELVLLQIKFAENYGNIEEALVDTVQYMKRNLKAKKRLIKTLQYPVALISIFLFILTILNITVIPQFQQLYETMNVKLSTFQNLLTLIITRLPKLTFIFIFISGIAFFITYKFYYYLPIEKKLKSILKIPMINTYYKYIELINFPINFLYFTEMVQVFNKLSVYIVMSKITIFLNFWVIIFLKKLIKGSRYLLY